MAQVTKDSVEMPYFEYLDWTAITQAERTILHDILFKEPEASEAQRRLFEFLILIPGEVIPPIPRFRLPEKCQEETMPHMGNILNLQQIHHPPLPPHSVVTSYGVGLIPATSGQNGHPITNQPVWVDTRGGQAAPPGLGGHNIRGSFTGPQMVPVGPNFYQQMLHHPPPQQYGSPSFISHLTHQQQHYSQMSIAHLQYASPMPPPYTTDNHSHSHQSNKKGMDLDSNISISPSAMGSGTSGNVKGFGRKGNSRPHARSDLQSQQQLNSFNTTLPYYHSMPTGPMYGTVYYSNPALAANVTGQPIILPPPQSTQPVYQPYPTQQLMYPGGEMDHETGNLLQDSTPQQVSMGVDLAETIAKPPEFVPDSNEETSQISPAYSSEGDTTTAVPPPPTVLEQPCTPSQPVSKFNSIVLSATGEEQKLGSKEGDKSSSQQQQTIPTSIENPLEKPSAIPAEDVKKSTAVQAEKEIVVEPVPVSGPIKEHPTAEDLHTSTNSRPSGRTGQGQTEEKTTSTEFPQLPPNGPTTNGIGFLSSPVVEGGHRSWASIASMGGSGSASDTPVSRVGPSDSQSSPSNHNISNVPTMSMMSGATREPHLAFDPACLSNGSDPIALSLGEFLGKYQLNHHCLSLMPRGLVNQSNFCYINATLQSLLACPPFVNLFRSLDKIIGRKTCKATPILQSVYDFVMDFEPISRLNANNKNKRPNDAFLSGPPLDPTGIRRVLSLLDGATFKVEGRQEDAEEFLSHLLNGLHDEMVKTIRWYEAKRDGKSQANTATIHQGHPEPSQKLNGDSGIVEDAEWQVMGPKNKGSMTRKTEVSKSPISEMFVGQMSSLLNRGNTPKTTTLQPFFTLQLDIQDANIHSVKDALEGLSTKEEVSGSSTTSGAEAPISMWKQLSLEFLPIILVIHLKRFVYDKNCSKIFKLDKRVDFGVDLVIEKELLSVNCKSKMFLKQRSYKLFSAVYHDGEEAHKGHYITDTFHPSGGALWGQFGWIRYDDTDTKSVTENQVLTPQPPRVPYLLYYRRVDTLSPGKKLL